MHNGIFKISISEMLNPLFNKLATDYVILTLRVVHCVLILQ